MLNQFKKTASATLLMPKLQEVFDAIVISPDVMVCNLRLVAFLVSIWKICRDFSLKLNASVCVNADYHLAAVLADRDNPLFNAAKCNNHCLNHMFRGYYLDCCYLNIKTWFIEFGFVNNCNAILYYCYYYYLMLFFYFVRPPAQSSCRLVN